MAERQDGEWGGCCGALMPGQGSPVAQDSNSAEEPVRGLDMSLGCPLSK